MKSNGILLTRDRDQLRPYTLLLTLPVVSLLFGQANTMTSVTLCVCVMPVYRAAVL